MRTLALLLCALTGAAFAQSDFVKPGSIGTPAPAASPCAVTERQTPPITCWVGQKILFLPRSADLSTYGYLSFKGGTGAYGRVSYDEAVGKIATVTKVTKGTYTGFDVEVRMDDSGKVYTATGYSLEEAAAALDGVALLKELQDARAALKGKSVWLSTGSLGQYDDTSGRSSYVKVRRYQPAVIEDVVAGWYEYSPVRLIVRTPSGLVGYVDVAYADLNSGTLRRILGVERSVFLTDPRQTFLWPDAVWTALEQDQIIPGMTKAQVEFGNPQTHGTTQTTTQNGVIEQWTFKSYGIVTFLNGVVTSFTTLP